jgi:hypothetical protein
MGIIHQISYNMIKDKVSFSNKKRVIAITAAAIPSLLVASIVTWGGINNNNGVEEAQAQTGTSSNAITVTGTAENEQILINEDDEDSEICTFAGAVVRGSGVTSLGQSSSCQDSNSVYGWDISPNPSGRDTSYKVVGKGVSSRIGVSDGAAKDNDVYSLDANQFIMHDGAGDDVYSTVSNLVDRDHKSVSYSDSDGKDKMSFAQR